MLQIKAIIATVCPDNLGDAFEQRQIVFVTGIESLLKFDSGEAAFLPTPEILILSLPPSSVSGGCCPISPALNSFDMGGIPPLSFHFACTYLMATDVDLV